VPATHGLAHGQKVNVGSVTQLVLEGAPVGELRDFVEFTTRVGVPTTLTEVGLRADDVDSLKRGCRRRHGRGRDDPRDAVRGPQRRRGERARVDRAVREAGAARANLPDPVPYTAPTAA
jgi:glycerol dehydrogenase